MDPQTSPAKTPKILAFSGSARKDSFNKKVLQIAVVGAKTAGAEVTVVDFRDLGLPLFDQDSEAASGLPENARKLKALMKSHEGFLIACPEYNSSITPLLKNAIDWASRSEPGEEPLVCYKGKVAALMSASPGALGGLRGLVTARSILGNLGVLVLPDQIAVYQAHEAFKPDGNLKEPGKQTAVENLGRKVAYLVSRLK